MYKANIVKRGLRKIERILTGRYMGKILASKPMICDKNSEFELHIVTSERDFLMAMWCLKSFYFYSGFKAKLVIHDDGTLSDDSINAFRDHFINCEVIKKKAADLELARALKDYQFISKYRFSNFIPNSMKLLDALFFSSSNKILILDSDVLFFKKPDELINNIKNNKGFFMRDCQTSYSLPLSTLERLFNIKIKENVNCGIVYWPDKKYYDLNIIEQYLREMDKADLPNKIWLEQTVTVVFFSKCNEFFVQLGESYQISKQEITDKTTGHHFVWDEWRLPMYVKGIKRLRSAGFLKKIS